MEDTKITERSKNSMRQFKNRPQWCVIFRGKNRQLAFEKTKIIEIFKRCSAIKPYKFN